MKVEIVSATKYTATYTTIVTIVYVNKAGSRSLRQYQVYANHVRMQQPIRKDRNITWKCVDAETEAWVREVMTTAVERNPELTK